jgi:hypothetical protein
VIYIWIRATLDWEDEEAFRAQLAPDMRPMVDLWNETFSLPFHLFRHRLRQIAQVNLSSVEGVVCAGWREIPHGSLVVPIDDDDWLAPDLGSVLESEHDAGAMGYYWIASFAELPLHFGHRVHLIRRRLLPWTPPRWIFSTNTYAMVKGPHTEMLLRSHVLASHWFRGPARSARSMKRIERRLSVINRTLASRTSLLAGGPLSRRQLIRKFRGYRELYRKPAAPELAWSSPYLAMMSDLMDELEPVR